MFWRLLLFGLSGVAALPSSARSTVLDVARGTAFGAVHASTLLPSVDCVRAMTTHDKGSMAYVTLRAELVRVGLWARTTMQFEALDPDGGRAGCFRAHVHAWQAGVAGNCTHMLVLEDDVSFHASSLPAWNARTEHFLRAGRPYDMLFAGFDLGWGDSLQEGMRANASVVTTATPLPSPSRCVYVLENWRSTHAYIISRTAMAEWRTLTADASSEPIDFHLPRLYNARRGFIAVRPKVAFQRFHDTSIPWAETASTDAGSYRLEEAARANEVLAEGMPTRGANETVAEYESRFQVYFEAMVSDPKRSVGMDEEFLYADLPPSKATCIGEWTEPQELPTTGPAVVLVAADA